jgi:Leucine Rich repeat
VGFASCRPSLSVGRPFSEGESFWRSKLPELISSTLPQTLIQKAGGGYCLGAEEDTQDVDSLASRSALFGVFFFFRCVEAGGGINPFFFGVEFFRVICLFDTSQNLVRKGGRDLGRAAATQDAGFRSWGDAQETDKMAATKDWRAELDRVLRAGEEKLDLRECSLGDAGAAEVAEKLRANRNNVKNLYLGGNKIGDAGATAIAALLRQNNGDGSSDAESASGMGDSGSGGAALEYLYLHFNTIGRKGIADLSDALRHNTTLRELWLARNPGVDAAKSSEAEAVAGIDSLLSAIAVNTTLTTVRVVLSSIPHQKTIEAALADTEGRKRGRELFLSGPMTKAARPQQHIA